MIQKESPYSRFIKALPWLVWLVVALLLGAARPWEHISYLMSEKFYISLIKALVPWVIAWAGAWAAVIIYYKWYDKRLRDKRQRFEAEFRSNYDVHDKKEVKS